MVATGADHVAVRPPHFEVEIEGQIRVREVPNCLQEVGGLGFRCRSPIVSSGCDSPTGQVPGYGSGLWRRCPPSELPTPGRWTG